MRRFVAVAVKAHRLDPPLHRVLAEQVPRVGKLEKLETFSRENFSLFRAYLESHRDELRVEDLELASFVCVTTIEALTHNAVLHHAKVLTDDAMETLIDEARAPRDRLSEGLRRNPGPRRSPEDHPGRSLLEGSVRQVGWQSQSLSRRLTLR